mmetsp:Transcript_33745/g.101899  ORF Transcript_33745/g.101899 Transcript_33745/m.101899 type:complete len:222 (-) Transcript_33745:18-683(-)
MIDYRVPCDCIAAEAILTLVKFDELAGSDVAQVADARAVLLPLPLQVVVEEEDSRVLILRCCYRRDHLGEPVGLLVVPPDREARRRHVEVHVVLAQGEVPPDVLPRVVAGVHVDVKDVEVAVQRQGLDRVLLAGVLQMARALARGGALARAWRARIKVCPMARTVRAVFRRVAGVERGHETVADAAPLAHARAPTPPSGSARNSVGKRASRRGWSEERGGS